MAGEKIGRFYEFLIVVAIEDALRQAGKNLEVHWNLPKGELMVQPDVLVGDVDRPTIVLMVTRSGARRGWDKKFWRNVGELLDVRSVYRQAGIASVALGSELKEELVAAQAALVDISVFPPRDQRTRLEDWAAPLADKCPVGESEARSASPGAGP